LWKEARKGKERMIWLAPAVMKTWDPVEVEEEIARIEVTRPSTIEAVVKGPAIKSMIC
jgi:hypothetical protein